MWGMIRGLWHFVPGSSLNWIYSRSLSNSCVVMENYLEPGTPLYRGKRTITACGAVKQQLQLAARLMSNIFVNQKRASPQLFDNCACGTIALPSVWIFPWLNDQKSNWINPAKSCQSLERTKVGSSIKLPQLWDQSQRAAIFNSSHVWSLS